jgi:hypothetical protein
MAARDMAPGRIAAGGMVTELNQLLLQLGLNSFRQTQRRPAPIPADSCQIPDPIGPAAGATGPECRPFLFPAPTSAQKLMAPGPQTNGSLWVWSEQTADLPWQRSAKDRPARRGEDKGRGSASRQPLARRAS